MTRPSTSKHRRLLAIERELRLLRQATPEVLALKALTAQQAATITRLVGENDALRRNRIVMVAELESLRERAKAAARVGAA